MRCEDEIDCAACQGTGEGHGDSMCVVCKGRGWRKTQRAIDDEGDRAVDRAKERRDD